ncbi:MAG: tryptophan halogenase family protein [Pseudomonadota bacterium]
MGEPLKSITIVGGGTAGWLAATLLNAYCRQTSEGQPPMQITLIESPDIPTVGVGEATTPGMVRTLKDVGISEKEFFKTCNASFKLGVSFDNWNVDKDGKPFSYINPFVRAPALRGIDMGNYFVNYGGGAQDFVGTYTATNGLVKALKGPRASGTKDYGQGASFAYHLDAGKFAALLQKHCVQRGVVHILENVKGVTQDERGYISGLELEKSGHHPVELVLDCTGFKGMIINEVLKEPFVDYSKYLANDRAMAVQIPHKDATKIEPVTRSTALGAGWSWRVPLYNRVGTGYVFSSAHRTDEEARDELLAHLGHPEGAEPRVIPMRVGRNRNAWVKNCLSIGLSGGFIEPLESTAIYMIDLAVRWLITYLPDSDFADPLRARYNKMMDALYNEVRDFICLHYQLGNRTDSQYWIDARTEMEVPDSLAENLELWRYAIPQAYDLRFATLFGHNVYVAVLLGKRVYETDYRKGRIGIGYNLDLGLWQAARKDLRQRTETFVKQAMDHRTLLTELRGEAVAPAMPAQQPGNFAFPFGGQATVPMPGMAAPKVKITPAAPKLDPVEAGGSML